MNLRRKGVWEGGATCPSSGKREACQESKPRGRDLKSVGQPIEKKGRREPHLRRDGGRRRQKGKGRKNILTFIEGKAMFRERGVSPVFLRKKRPRSPSKIIQPL